MISIRVSDTRVLARLSTIEAADRLAIQPALAEFGDEQVAEFRNLPYPPERAGQTYIRTFDLRGSWSGQASTRTRYVINNDANARGNYYAVYVVGDGDGEGQAWMHKRRWWKARDIIDQRMPRFTDKLRERMGL